MKTCAHKIEILGLAKVVKHSNNVHVNIGMLGGGSLGSGAVNAGIGKVGRKARGVTKQIGA